MKPALVAIVGLVLLMIAIAALAPASIVDRRLAATSAGNLRLSEPRGTVWNGTGILTDASGSWRLPVGWSISLPALARGTVSMTLLPVAGGTPRGTIGFATGAATLRDVVIELPAAILTGALASRGAIVTGGNLVFIAPAFEWSGERGSGTLNVQWRNGRLVAAGTAADVGTVDVALEAKGNRLAGRIGNSAGDVRIDGTITVTESALGIDAAIAPLPSTPPPILRALAALGTPDSTGAVRITWRSTLQ